MAEQDSKIEKKRRRLDDGSRQGKGKEGLESDELSQGCLWLTWQLCDSSLPTGGFAHSLGLESAVQLGVVKNKDNVADFTRRLLNSVARNSVPLVVSGCRTKGNIDHWASLDRLCHVSMANHVSRRASEASGSALLRVAIASYPEASDLLSAVKQRLRSDTTLRAHHAPLFGFICGALGIKSSVAARMLLFSTLRDVIAAATRLNLVGPLEAACLTRSLTADAEAALEGPPLPPHAFLSASLSTDFGKAMRRDEIEAVPSAVDREPILEELGIKKSGIDEKQRIIEVPLWQTDPILDVIQGYQDRLYSRLFLS